MIAAADLLVPARASREGVENFAPMVTYMPREGRAAIGLVVEPDLHAGLDNLLTQMRERLGSARWIAATLDAYVKQVAPEDVDKVAPGSMGSEFAAGSGEVAEQLVVVLVAPNRSVTTATQVYRYTPADGWEWDEPVTTEEAGGTIAALLLRHI